MQIEFASSKSAKWLNIVTNFAFIKINVYICAFILDTLPMYEVRNHLLTIKYLDYYGIT